MIFTMKSPSLARPAHLKLILLSMLTALVVAMLAAQPLAAQNREVPYWASLDSEEVNMRVGPSPDYKIDWVYKRKGLPVRVVRVMEGWRLIQDPDGAQGWVVKGLLTAQRGALVIGEELAPMREGPTHTSGLRWNLEPGVVGALGECDNGWCTFDVDGRRGYVEQTRLWGAGEP